MEMNWSNGSPRSPVFEGSGTYSSGDDDQATASQPSSPSGDGSMLSEKRSFDSRAAGAKDVLFTIALQGDGAEKSALLSPEETQVIGDDLLATGKDLFAVVLPARSRTGGEDGHAAIGRDHLNNRCE
jgi:hypothetical protein